MLLDDLAHLRKRRIWVMACLFLGQSSLLHAYEDILPNYKSLRPQWGFQLSVSPSALGEQALTEAQGTATTFAFTLSAEYQPKNVQRFGVFGFGPILALYPIFGADVTSHAYDISSVGGVIRYQARFVREQVLVPIVAYEASIFHYSFKEGTSGNLLLQGPTVGLWLYLNFLEPSTAGESYANNGVLRNYAIFEYRLLSGHADNLPRDISGGSWFFGLRVELL